VSGRVVVLVAPVRPDGVVDSAGGSSGEQCEVGGVLTQPRLAGRLDTAAGVLDGHGAENPDVGGRLGQTGLGRVDVASLTATLVVTVVVVEVVVLVDVVGRRRRAALRGQGLRTLTTAVGALPVAPVSGVSLLLRGIGQGCRLAGVGALTSNLGRLVVRGRADRDRGSGGVGRNRPGEVEEVVVDDGVEVLRVQPQGEGFEDGTVALGVVEVEDPRRDRVVGGDGGDRDSGLLLDERGQEVAVPRGQRAGHEQDVRCPRVRRGAGDTGLRQAGDAGGGEGGAVGGCAVSQVVQQVPDRRLVGDPPRPQRLLEADVVKDGGHVQVVRPSGGGELDSQGGEDLAGAFGWSGDGQRPDVLEVDEDVPVVEVVPEGDQGRVWGGHGRQGRRVQVGGVLDVQRPRQGVGRAGPGRGQGRGFGQVQVELRR